VSSAAQFPDCLSDGQTTPGPKAGQAEGESGTHNDVDIALIDPSGTTRATSDSAASVFELARATGPLAVGTWKLRVFGYDVLGSQQVYVAGVACR